MGEEEEGGEFGVCSCIGGMFKQDLSCILDLNSIFLINSHMKEKDECNFEREEGVSRSHSMFAAFLHQFWRG